LNSIKGLEEKRKGKAATKSHLRKQKNQTSESDQYFAKFAKRKEEIRGRKLDRRLICRGALFLIKKGEPGHHRGKSVEKMNALEVKKVSFFRKNITEKTLMKVKRDQF